MAAEDIPLLYSDATIGGTGQDRLNNLGGTQLSLNGFTSATINDTNDTGVTGDADTDDESPTGPENWLINGSTKTLLEVVVYDNSILYLNDGTSVQLDVVMFLYDDGTYAFSAKSITDGMPNDISELNPNNIDYTQGITLGTQRNTEYTQVEQFQEYRDFFICFATGTLIDTAQGPAPVETLNVGDEVRTLDNGYQQIRWIGSKEITGAALARTPMLRPVRIRAGVLGPDLPERDLVISRQHRVLIRSRIAQRMFGTKEILVPAIQLLGHDGIKLAEDMESVTYWHLLFDKHEVIFSEGMPTESLFTGPVALKSMSPEARQEIETLFPELMEAGYVARPARHIPEKFRPVRKLVERHTKNGQPLFC